MPPAPDTPAAQDFAAAHAVVCALCDHFDAGRADFAGDAYKEAEARAQFITPFFEALGWDVDNAAHRSVYEKDVVVEKRQDIGGHALSADYAFRRPGSHLTAFFAEAKKPSRDVRNHQDCYQAVQYGWNAKTPLVVLTNFAQLFVLDARAEPDRENSTRFILRHGGAYASRDYRDPEKFAELWGLLARASVAAGSLDRAAAALPRLSGRLQRDDLFARGSGPVDETFLAEMEGWREHLAKQFKKDNHHLDGERLTALTQRILDRLVFLRFLEDRGIEREFTFAAIGKGGSAWHDFLSVSTRLDRRYNGIIYKSDPSGCEDKDLVVDDVVFAGVARRFAPENSKYLFNSISVTILGSIYERFLGNVIVSRNKTAVVEPKPEVRKAGGVYYTPDYIVRYIVEQTVGRAIEGKKPTDIAKLRFADIACGSGSFLVEVFACLIRYHLKWYLADGGDKWAKKGILRARERDDEYVLTLAEKRRLLLDNVYGVDLDPQAVEVTQLSLYLRLMEDESFPSTQLLFDEERRALLPNLRDNIVRGNSLMENDVTDLFGLSQKEEDALHPLEMRWAFKNIRPNKYGELFDAIVGNPPYVRPHNLTPQTKQYLWEHYKTFTHKADLYCAFIERATDLLKDGGRFSYIVSKGWLRLNSFQEVRRLFLKHYTVEELIEFGFRVFTDAQVDTAIFCVNKGAPDVSNDHQIATYYMDRPAAWPPDAARASLIPQSAFETTYEQVFDLSIVPAGQSLKAKMLAGPTIGEEFDICFGVKTGDDSMFLHHTAGLHPEDRRLLRGDDVKRYATYYKEEYVWYVPERMRAHRTTARPGEPSRFEQPKVLVKDTSKDFACTYDAGRFYVKDVLIIIPHPAKPSPYDLRFVAGIINSAALRYFYRSTFKTIHVQRGELASLPLPALDALITDDEDRHAKMVKLVTQMLAAKKAETERKDNADHWRRTSVGLDRQIDALVYELYGLTDEEISLVEGES